MILNQLHLVSNRHEKSVENIRGHFLTTLINNNFMTLGCEAKELIKFMRHKGKLNAVTLLDNFIVPLKCVLRTAVSSTKLNK